MQQRKEHPYLSFRFWVEINSVVVGGFSEVSGLQSEIEIETVEEGGINNYVHKFPKKAKSSNIILKRGITDSDDLWKWHEDILSGKMERKSMSIILFDNERKEKWRWGILEAYPVKWTISELKADSNTVAIESVEFVHNGITKVGK
jgi:phage tail-like protein